MANNKMRVGRMMRLIVALRQCRGERWLLGWPGRKQDLQVELLRSMVVAPIEKCLCAFVLLCTERGRIFATTAETGASCPCAGQRLSMDMSHRRDESDLP